MVCVGMFVVLVVCVGMFVVLCDMGQFAGVSIVHCILWGCECMCVYKRECVTT